MTYTLEDYLVGLHTGSWFTWTDSSSKVYANLILAPVMNNEAGEEIANPHSLPQRQPVLLVLQHFKQNMIPKPTQETAKQNTTN